MGAWGLFSVLGSITIADDRSLTLREEAKVPELLAAL